MDESNVPSKIEHGFNFFDDVIDCCESKEPCNELQDPCNYFSFDKEKIYQFDGQLTRDVTHLWAMANKKPYTPLTNGICPLMGQSKDEVNALLEISEKQGKRNPDTVEKIVISEHTVNEIKKQMQRLESFHEQQQFYEPPVCTARKKRKTKYERLKIKHARLEKRVAELEELCQCLKAKQ